MTAFRLIAAGALLAAFAVPSAGFAATVMVVRASGPSEARYPAGRLLDEAAPIVLQEGDELTILDGAGTRELSGPVRLRNAGARQLGADAAASLSRMLAAGAGRRNVAAGTRDAAAAMRAAVATDNFWTIDLDGGGNWCVAQGTPIRLSRHDAQAPATLTIAPMGRRAETLGFAAGQSRLDWEIAPAAGARLTLRIAGSAEAIGVRVIADEFDDPMRLAEALDADHCDAQLATLAARLR